jgi:hypothetical protein
LWYHLISLKLTSQKSKDVEPLELVRRVVIE